MKQKKNNKSSERLGNTLLPGTTREAKQKQKKRASARATHYCPEQDMKQNRNNNSSERPGNTLLPGTTHEAKKKQKNEPAPKQPITAQNKKETILRQSGSKKKVCRINLEGSWNNPEQ